MRYTLRPATPGDLEPMMAIGHEGIRPYVEAVRGWDEAAEERGFREHFTPEHISIVEVDDRAAGYVKVESHPDYLYLDGLYLHHSYRGRGIGAALITSLIAKARAERKPLRLRVLRPNPARHLYERLGFRVIEENATHLCMEVKAEED